MKNMSSKLKEQTRKQKQKLENRICFLITRGKIDCRSFCNRYLQSIVPVVEPY